MRPSLSLLVAFVMLGGAFAGCLGGAKDGGKKDVSTESVAPTGPAPNATVDAGMGNVDASDTNASLAHMPHLHDYWQSRERVTLMDSDIQVDAGGAMRYTFVDISRGNPAVGGAQFRLPDEKIVYEGTGKLEVTLTWTDATVTGTGLSYVSPASPSSYSAPKDMKSAAPLTVDVTPDMCDMPHAKNSQWGFLLLPNTAGQVVYGKIHVKVDIIRMRDITLFPAHPDLWRGAHELTIFKGSGSSTQDNVAVQLVNFVSRSQTDDAVKATGLVPMETMSMTGNLTIKNVQVEVGKAASVQLRVKTASSNQYYSAKLIKSDPATNTYWYAWLVDMRMADGSYAKESNWKFDVYVNADTTGQGTQFCRGGMGVCLDAKVDYELLVTAYDTVVEGAAKLPQGGRGGNSTAQDLG